MGYFSGAIKAIGILTWYFCCCVFAGYLQGVCVGRHEGCGMTDVWPALILAFASGENDLVVLEPSRTTGILQGLPALFRREFEIVACIFLFMLLVLASPYRELPGEPCGS